MKAIIMAGGEGSRLRPLTCTMPKPMTRIMNRPAMEHILRLLKKHGITEIGVTLAYMPDSIRSYFGDGHAFGVSLTYFLEETPMGTAGSVKNTGDFLNDDFLVISGDAICDMDISALISYHKSRRAVATIAIKPMEIPLAYGVIVTDKSGRIVRFLEKPDWSQVVSDTVNTGVYVLSPRVMEYIQKTPCDFSAHVFPALLKEGAPMYGFVTEGYWCDIGDLDAYRHCHCDVFAGKIALPFFAQEVRPGIFLETGAVLEAGAHVNPPVLIGKNSIIKNGAVIDSFTVIGENCTVFAGASIKRSVLYDHVRVGENAQIRGAVLCPHTTVHKGASLFEQAILGEGSTVGRDAFVRPGVKIWPAKTVGQGEILSENLVWGTSTIADLFGERDIAGQVGADISPAFACKIGTAVGSLFQDAPIGIACDGSPAAVMLKLSLSGGLLASGARVFDFGDQPLPITRSGVKVYGLRAGVHIGVHRGQAFLYIMDENGADISREYRRKLESLFAREDFVLCDTEKVLNVQDLYAYKLHYLRQIINDVSAKHVPLRILIGGGGNWGVKLLKGAAADLGYDLRILEGEIPLFDETAQNRFAQQVTLNNCDFGAVLDPACEKLMLCDERGRIVKGDVYTVLAAMCTMKKYRHANIVVSTEASEAVDILAEKYGATITRTKASPISLMEGLSGRTKDLEMQFILHFDAVGAVITLADFLYTNKQTLSGIVDEIPAFTILRREVDCAFGDKGRVIRMLTEKAENKDLTDGIKIFEKGGWVLILPDAKRPVVRMIAHSDREEYAAELTDIYDAKVREMLKNTSPEKDSSF